MNYLLIDGLAFPDQKCAMIMEEWKDIPGYEGLYQASNFGRIRTCEGKTTSNARFGVRVWKQRIMKPKRAANKNGRIDLRVELWKDGKHKTLLVSRLVAFTWCEGYKDGWTVNHKNGNQLDNRAENLEWLSHGDNIRHGFANGLYPQACFMSDYSYKDAPIGGVV